MVERIKDEMLSVLICVGLQIGALICWGLLSDDPDDYLDLVFENLAWFGLASACFGVAFLRLRHAKNFGLTCFLALFSTVATGAVGFAWLFYFAFFIVGVG